MCGIVAIIDPAAAAGDAGGGAPARREAQLVSMLDRIRHRGDPEHFGERWVAAGVALGTNRLAIVDRAHARQPLSDHEGSIRVVFNGELYGFQGLRHELECRGHRFRTASDTEVLIHAYLEWGDEFVERLDGMYAFVLYDRRRRRFVAARDHVGIKPLYHAVREGVHYFASEQKCLLGHADDVRPVLPGTYVTSDGTFRHFTLEVPDGEAWDRPDAEAVAEYQALFDDAVRKQVDTDLPVAVMFSGGIDSAAVLHVARQHHPDVTAFTVGFEGAADIAVATRYCREFGVPHVVSYLDPKALVDLVPSIVYGAEFFEAIDTVDACVGYLSYRAVRERGFKVALCGEGSDEVLAGYDLFRTHQDPLGLMSYRIHNLHRTDLQRVDRSSMLNTVEARVPFMDRFVLQFASSLPMRLKLRDGVEKWVLREAFKDRLPPYIANRPKVRMPDGTGVKTTILDHARRDVEFDQEIVRALGIDTREGVFFLKEYVDAGFPVPHERFKRRGFDYAANGYFEFIS